MAIAEEECATCFEIRPKTEMREVRVKRVVGKSIGSSSSSSTRSGSWNSFGSGRHRSGSSRGHGSRSGSSTRTDMAIYRVWVCKGCKAPPSDWEPGTVKLLAGTAAIALFFGYSALFGGSRPDAPAPNTTPAAEESAEPLLARPSGLSNTEEPGEAPPPSIAVENPPAAGQTQNEEAGTAPPATLVIGYDTPEVSMAVQETLKSGRPADWALGELRGYAVSSEPTQMPDGSCRSVAVTFEDKSRQQHALPTATYCNSGSGWTVHSD